MHAAIALGNPDTATNVSVTVPGVGSTTKDSLSSMVGEAQNLRRTAQFQLDRLGIKGSVATVAWMGYDPPANPLNTGSARDTWMTMTDDQAQAGATNLSQYLTQIHDTNPNAHLTLLGHSYGSLTSSLALQQLHSQGIHAVDDAVFYGSPGLELWNPINADGALGLDGQAYVMRAPGDYITAYIAPTAALHGWGADPYSGILPELSSQAGVSPDGVARAGAWEHADYPRAPDGSTLNMAGYNLATVVSGIPHIPGGADKLVMADVEAMNHSMPLPFVGRPK
ncbi:cutinase family protein [Mycolicibacterium moriokaense]|nr:cutinase family protein [Mycolicibacterium moriokaense]